MSENTQPDPRNLSSLGGPADDGSPAAEPDVEQAPGSALEDTLEHLASGATEQRSAKAAWLELPLAWISYLRTEINLQECVKKEEEQHRREVLLAGARKHLDIAESACREKRIWFNRFKKSNRLERIWANVRVADVNLLALSSDDELRARCSFVKVMVQQYISTSSPQRIEAERVLASLTKDPSSSGTKDPVSAQDRVTVVQALGISYAALDGRTRRVRILANMLWLVTGLTMLGAAGLALWGFFDPQTLSLCFEVPQKGDLTTNTQQPTPEDVIVCPTGEEAVDTERRFVDDYADPLDVLSVELAGLVGAALTTVAALRKISDNHTSPYALPLAAATLKFPMGAIAAFVGVLFIRGAFLPGLSALDTPVQILAWAVLFGAAQQLITHFIDRKAQTALSGVGKPIDPPVKNRAEKHH
ncbi:hypothetical protein [Streptomyces sp. NPDC093094]|uniref:hypothetical protein n=1 Tax=Streptomyces sp. NPDC093094 TaxID=3366026 RepID=UPI0037FB673C